MKEWACSKSQFGKSLKNFPSVSIFPPCFLHYYSKLPLSHIIFILSYFVWFYLLVIRGEVRDIEPENSMIKVALKITNVYKKGKKEFIVGSKLHVFQRASCKHPQLAIGHQIILMFKDKLIYLLDKDTYVLKWPSNAKKAEKLENALKEVQRGYYCG